MKKRYIFIIVFLIILVLFIRRTNNKTIKYKVKTNNELFSIIEKNNKNYYYYDIKWNKKEYPINIFKSNIKKKSINKIYNYNDDIYSCILPLFNGEILTDIMCYKDNVIYNYQAIKNESEKLDKYVDSIEEYKTLYKDTTKENKYNNIITFYNDVGKSISITTYKGIISKEKDVKLFDKDVYSNKISAYVDKYYITADYNSNYEFNKFYIVNLNDNEISTIKVKNPISFDSYVQGIVDNKVYIFDPENEIQYEIELKNKKINITSDENIKYYSNKKWSKVSVKQAKKELLFDYSSLDNIYNEYDRVYENSYYYYCIKKNKLYRINKNNTKVKTYIIDLPVNEITIQDDYLYYVDNNELYYYSDITGLKILLTNREFEFNKYIKYYIY